MRTTLDIDDRLLGSLDVDAFAAARAADEAREARLDRRRRD
jgi:hypothetical protein